MWCPQVIAPKQSGEQATQLGNKTECGMLGFVLGLGKSYQEIRDKNPEKNLFKVQFFAVLEFRKSKNAINIE